MRTRARFWCFDTFLHSCKDSLHTHLSIKKYQGDILKLLSKTCSLDWLQTVMTWSIRGWLNLDLAPARPKSTQPDLSPCHVAWELVFEWAKCVWQFWFCYLNMMYEGYLEWNSVKSFTKNKSKSKLYVLDYFQTRKTTLTSKQETYAGLT